MLKSPELVWTVDSDAGRVEFRWNLAHTVKVWVNGRSVDVFTVGPFDVDAADRRDVVARIREWLATNQLEAPGDGERL